MDPSAVGSQFCSVLYPDGTAHTTSAASLFEAAERAIHWCEEDCKQFGSARKLRDSDLLKISNGMGCSREYRVRVGRVRQWMRERENQP